MPRGHLTPDQRARQLAALKALRADPEFEARRLRALASPETKAKMRAAKLGTKLSPETIAKMVAPRIGVPLTPEHREKVAAAQRGRPLTEEHREAMTAAHRTPESRARNSEAQKRVGLTPAKAAHLARLNAKAKRPWTAEEKDRRSRQIQSQYEDGRRKYNALERRAAALLLVLGYVRFPRLGGHAFDFGSQDHSTLVEINGCRWHDHRAIKPSCPTEARAGSFLSDEAYRAIARAAGRRLVELWACEENEWPAILVAASRTVIGIPSLDA